MLTTSKGDFVCYQVWRVLLCSCATLSMLLTIHGCQPEGQAGGEQGEEAESNISIYIIKRVCMYVCNA
jgi:hypothetical protein